MKTIKIDMNNTVNNAHHVWVFATNNTHKLEEIRQIAGEMLTIRSLKDIGCHADIPETATTLEGNAYQKANYVWQHYHLPCFADDTGLEVEALQGAPGVYSARYAGEGHNAEANMKKLLHNMKGMENRSAQFRTIICLIDGNETRYFEGKVTGTILHEKHGREGFGYDPIFRPDGYEQSFAEMSGEDKNKISHRGKAVEKLMAHLKKSSTE